MTTTGAVIAVFAWRHARGHAHPMLDLWALGTKSFSVTIAGGTLFRISIGAVPFLLPLLFQVGFGMNAFDAGLLVLAVFAGNLAMKPLTTIILRRYPFRQILIVNGVISAALTAAWVASAFPSEKPVNVACAVCRIS